MKKPRPALTLLATLVAAASALLSLPGCSTRQAYSAGQSWQYQECNKINDYETRQRCMREAERSYENYQRERDKLDPMDSVP